MKRGKRVLLGYLGEGCLKVCDPPLTKIDRYVYAYIFLTLNTKPLNPNFRGCLGNVSLKQFSGPLLFRLTVAIEETLQAREGIMPTYFCRA